MAKWTFGVDPTQSYEENTKTLSKIFIDFAIKTYQIDFWK